MDGKASDAHIYLEHMLLDESVKPTKLPLSLLEAITNNFSDDLEIGRGGFAVVYKGILRNGTIAVKKLSKTLDMHEKTFIQEVQCLMKVRHKNIVRFLGYCADTQGEMTEYEGKSVLAEVRNRLLCFEFVPKGSLYEHITDASCGLEWRVRYQLIKGICEGLHYLHENHIVHLDLKPGNILLDNNMVPKIADFGLSRCFDENQSRAITSKLIGSVGYMAPEFYNGKITFKLDMYSLGVIVMEMLTGQKGYSTVDKVLESWRNRLEIRQEDTFLHQVRSCVDIGIACIDPNPENRPATQYIMDKLKKLERSDEFIEACEACCLPCSGLQLASSRGSTYALRASCGRGGRAEVDHLFWKLGLNGPKDFTIPPALYAAAMAHIPSSSRSRRQSLEDSLGRVTEGAAPQELLEMSGQDAMVAAKLEAAVEGEQAVLATQVVQPEAVEISARSVEGPEPESGSRVIESETAQVSTRVVAAVMKLGNADTKKEKGDPVKADQLQVEGTKAVVMEAPTETIGAPVQVVAESSSRDNIEHWISPSPHRPIKRTITTWIKGAHLGSGSFGSVYEAISDDGFFFAVKEVSLMDQGGDAKQRILQLEHEISLLSCLEHENIVQYFGTDKEGGKLYIFLELVTHGSLADLYQKYHLRDSQVSAYTRQILNGLLYLHQRNVLHRDIKCANILIDASGLVKLADFGLAKEMSILSQARSSKGTTVFWMAPEIAKAKPHGPRADIWSLGCTVLEMLTGKVPYPDMEWIHALRKIGRGIPPEIPDTLSEDARDFIKKCVQANPNDRPSAAQLLEHPFVQRPLQH